MVLRSADIGYKYHMGLSVSAPVERSVTNTTVKLRLLRISFILCARSPTRNRTHAVTAPYNIMAVLEKDEDEYDEYDVEKAHATPSVSPPRLVPRAVPTVVDTALPVVDRLAQAEWQQWSSPLRTSRPQRVATQQEERARAAPLGTHSPYRDDIARSTLHKIHGRAPEPEVTGSDLIEQHPLWKMELDLSGRGLPEVAGSIGSLTDLREVNLARNLLVELPKEVGRLRKLRVLDLSRNMLAALPPSLGCLHQLERLVASHNMLEMLPSTLGALEHLRTLDVSQNKLRRLPDSFGLSQPVMTEEAAQETSGNPQKTTRNQQETRRILQETTGNPQETRGTHKEHKYPQSTHNGYPRT